MMTRVCHDCGAEREMKWVKPTEVQRCYSCAQKHRNALARLVRLKPTIDRIGAALMCARKIASVTTEKLEPRWNAMPERGDVAELLSSIALIEAELENAADEWSVLLLGGAKD